MFDYLERIAKIVQNFAIICGIFVSAATLVYTQYEKRVDRAIEYKKDFDSSYRAKYLAMSNRWNDFNDNDPKQRIFSPDNTVQKEAVIEFFAKKENNDDLNDILDFYDNLFVCVRNHSCDGNATIELFGTQAREISDEAEYYMRQLRSKDRDNRIGEGVEAIAQLQSEGLFSKLFPQFSYPP